MTASVRARFIAVNAASSSLGSRTVTPCTTTPKDFAALSASRRLERRGAIRRDPAGRRLDEARGINCLKLQPFDCQLTDQRDHTRDIPPGRAKPVASPSATGSPPVAMTIGIELVSCLAA